MCTSLDAMPAYSDCSVHVHCHSVVNEVNRSHSCKARQAEGILRVAYHAQHVKCFTFYFVYLCLPNWNIISIKEGSVLFTGVFLVPRGLPGA